MSNSEKLKVIFNDISRLESQVHSLQQDAKEILGPLFDQQSSMAHKVSLEPEFADLKEYFGRHPASELRTSAPEITGYEPSTSTNSYYENAQWRDGETDYAHLLPEFIDGTEEEKMEAVRNFYRKKLSEKTAWIRQSKEDAIERARKTLEAAGIPVG